MNDIEDEVVRHVYADRRTEMKILEYDNVSPDISNFNIFYKLRP